jgi:phospholipid/cholesterol/gamma-HCH transport system substrate-binding protein
MSRAIQALQDGSGDAFSTVKNLQVFVGALAESDQQISEFTSRLDSVSGLLVDDKQAIRTGLSNLSSAVGKVEAFVRTNRASLKSNILGLTDVTQVVANEQESLAQTLQVAPNALANLIEAVHQRQNAVGVDLHAANIHSPGQLVCGAIGGASETSGAQLGQLCQSVLGSVLDQAAGNPTTTSFIGLLEKILGIQ